MNTLGIVALVNFNDWDNPDYAETGGINTVIKDLLPHLLADKIILYGFTYDKANLYKEKIVSSRIVVFPIVFIPKQPTLPIRLFGLLRGWRLRSYIRKHSVQNIYCHAEELGVWLPLKGLKCIHHVHTFVNVLEVSARKSARIKFIQTLWECIRTHVIKNSYRIIAVNKDIANLISSLTDAKKIIKFPNYVDTEKFSFSSPEDLQNTLQISEQNIVIHVGRISRIKGLEFFVDIIVALNNHTNHNNWMGILVGNGEYEETLKKYVRLNNLEDKIMFVGAVNDASTLSQYYSLANVSLITSWSESVPLTLLESLSCGTPVVSTNVGITSEVLSKGNGFFVNSRSPFEFAEKIIDSMEFKSRQSLLPDKVYYSVNYAADQLNTAFNYHKN